MTRKIPPTHPLFKKPTKTHPLKRLGAVYRSTKDFLNQFEKDPFIRLIVTVTFLATAWQVWEDIEDRQDERGARQEEREARQEERIARAWSILTTRASGNSGKAAAIEILYKAGISLEGIDLSCETMGGGWDEETLNCERPVSLAGMDLRSPNALNLSFRDLNQSSAAKLDTRWRRGCVSKLVELPFEPSGFGFARYEINSGKGAVGFPPHFRDKERKNVLNGGADFSRAKLSGVDFSGAKISGANFQDADLRGANFYNTVAEAIDLNNARLQGALFSRTYLSGSIFRNNFKSCEIMRGIYILGASGPDANECRFDKPKKKIVIKNSYLNSVILEAETLFSFYIINSEVNNSNLYYQSYDFDNKVKSNIPRDYGNDTLLYNDYTCSIFHNDQEIILTNSNISGALFPSRYKIADEFIIPEGKMVDLSKEIGLERKNWDELNAIWSPWAWADNPPIGNLADETVAKCDQYEARKPADDHQIAVSPPLGCNTVGSELSDLVADSLPEYQLESPREVFQLPRPIPISETDLVDDLNPFRPTHVGPKSEQPISGE